MLFSYLKWLMGNKKKLSRTKNMSQESLTITYDLNSEFGSAEEHKKARQFGEEIQMRVSRTSVGEYDGDEFGDNEVSLFIYGDSADKIYDSLKPLLQKTEIRPLRIMKMHIKDGRAEFSNEILS